MQWNNSLCNNYKLNKEQILRRSKLLSCRCAVCISLQNLETAETAPWCGLGCCSSTFYFAGDRFKTRLVYAFLGSVIQGKVAAGAPLANRASAFGDTVLFVRRISCLPHRMCVG